VVVTTALVSGFSAFVLREILQDEGPVLGASAASLHSTVLGEEREYFVHLPEGYETDSSKRYPVMYVLDGTSQSAHTAASAALLARVGLVPPMIVVGVPSVDGDSRNRDYTPPDMRLDTDTATSSMGAADRFLSFLETELIVQVERELRTARPRMLAGWSRGGLFAVYSQMTKPAMFDARFAHSPALWREGNLIVGRLEGFLKTPDQPAAYLYLSLGDQENEKMTAAFRQTVDMLERQAPSWLRWRADLSAGGDHESNPRLSAPVGLCAMFASDPKQACRPARP
jgi:predicted alpha/beta superfamily hydrolase